MFLSTKKVEKKISKWLVFMETEIAFCGLLLISYAIMNFTMNKQDNLL